MSANYSYGSVVQDYRKRSGEKYDGATKMPFLYFLKMDCDLVWWLYVVSKWSYTSAAHTILLSYSIKYILIYCSIWWKCLLASRQSIIGGLTKIAFSSMCSNKLNFSNLVKIMLSIGHWILINRILYLDLEKKFIGSYNPPWMGHCRGFRSSLMSNDVKSGRPSRTKH